MRTQPPSEPGDFFVVRTNGWAGRLIRWVTRSSVNHAGVLVYGGRIVEARPSGAGYSSRPTDALWSHQPLTDDQRGQIVAAATGFVGNPYSWLDCVCIGLADRFGTNVPAAIRNRLQRPDRMICSQLVDSAYLDAGVHLFADGRDPGAVSPEDLRQTIIQEGP